MSEDDNSVSQFDRVYNVYIDEAGHTPYYNDKDQRVLTLSGIITDADENKFDFHTRQLLAKYGIPQDTEIHINEIFSSKPPFDKFDERTQQDLVFNFLKEGLEYIDFVHLVSPIKPFMKPKGRIELEERNLDLYLYTLYQFASELDFYFCKSEKGKYRLIFDKTSDFHKRTKKMIEELCKMSDSYSSLKRIVGPPEQLDSKCSRFIQLADATCYIYTRYRQFEVKTLKKPANLMKYEVFYKKCYRLIKDKLLPFLKLYLEGISGESQAIFDFKEIETRNFNHLGNWLTKKKKPDVFDPTVNTFWELSYLKMTEQVSEIEKLLNNPENIFNRLRITNPVEAPAVILVIVERYKNRMKNINRNNKEWEQEFPGAKRLLNLLEDYSKTLMENYSPPKTGLDNQLLLEKIADQIEIEVNSRQINDASGLEQYINRNNYYFNKIISTIYFFGKANYDYAKRMKNAYTDNINLQANCKILRIYAEYLMFYTEEINALDQDIFEASEKVIICLKIIMLKIPLFHQIQSEKQQSFTSALINFNLALANGISQNEGFLKGLKPCMNILKEAHYAFNSIDKLSKKIVKLKAYSQKLINILNTNKISDNLGTVMK